MKEISLGGKHGRGKFALVDDEDYDRVKDHGWCLGNGYVMSTVKGKTVRMHRLIMGFPEAQVDHRNGNPLDNRRANLRICTCAENQMNRGKRRDNTSGFKGVIRRGNRWQARIKKNRKMIHLGYFETPEEAAAAYDKKAIEFFGEFARINGIGGKDGKTRFAGFKEAE